MFFLLDIHQSQDAVEETSEAASASDSAPFPSQTRVKPKRRRRKKKTKRWRRKKKSEGKDSYLELFSSAKHDVTDKVPTTLFGSSSHKCNTTIISAYYKIRSKHSHEEYVEWMTNFLTIKDCIVVFVHPEQESIIRELRPPEYPLIIITFEIDSFLMSSLVSIEEWKQQEEKDPEQDIGHNRDLYKVWNEKTNMMKIASEQNPFSSSYFIWMDIGSVRESDRNHQQMVKNIPKEKGILLLLVKEFTDEEIVLVEGKSLAELSDIEARIGGGAIGGDKQSLEIWHKAFYKTIRSYLDEGKFIGKDQNLMATTCLESDMCLLVHGHGDEDNGIPNPWFMMQPWLRGELSDGYTRMDAKTENKN